jgi:hypothetical protein
MFSSILASLEIVKSEVGTMDGKLVGKEVAHDYEEQKGQNDDRACSQLERTLEWSEVV